MSTIAARGMPKFETGPQKSVGEEVGQPNILKGPMSQTSNNYTGNARVEQT